MAIHITWKEIAARLGDIDRLAKIAEVLSVGNATVPMVYFEFESPEQLSYFCKAVRMVPFIAEIDELEKRRDQLILEIDKLQTKVDKKKPKALKDAVGVV